MSYPALLSLVERDIILKIFVIRNCNFPSGFYDRAPEKLGATATILFGKRGGAIRFSEAKDGYTGLCETMRMCDNVGLPIEEIFGKRGEAIRFSEAKDGYTGLCETMRMCDDEAW